MNRSDLVAFLANVMIHCSDGATPWTAEDARYNLSCWRADGVEGIPDDVTAEDVATTWNDLIIGNNQSNNTEGNVKTMTKIEAITNHRDAIANEMIDRYRAVLEADGTIQYRIYLWDDGEIQSMEQVQGDRTWLESRDSGRRLYYITAIDAPCFNPWGSADCPAPDDEDEREAMRQEIIDWCVDQYRESISDTIDAIIEDAASLDE